MKRVFAAFFAATLSIFLVACGNAPASSTSSESSVISTPTPTIEPTPEAIPDLTGVWKQVEANESYQQAIITNDTIEITWEGDNTSSLYWAGSFDPPTKADEPYVWESQNDYSRTENAILASGDETKAFTYEGGYISYEVSAFGTTTTLKIEKISNDIPPTPTPTPMPIETPDPTQAPTPVPTEVPVQAGIVPEQSTYDSGGGTEAPAAQTETPAEVVQPSGQGVTVYIASSGNGTKYHSNPNCSRMNDATPLTKSEAESREYTPCKKCYG